MMQGLTPEEESAFTQQVNQWKQTKASVPEESYKTISTISNGITQPVWGRAVDPYQVAWLHQQGINTPQALHQFWGSQQHPHAPSLKLAEYPVYAQAYKEWKKVDDGGKK